MIEVLQIFRSNGITTGRVRDSDLGVERWFHVVATISDEQLLRKLKGYFRSSQVTMAPSAPGRGPSAGSSAPRSR